MKVNETIELWTKMWMADSDRYNKMRNLLESMQKSSEACVVDLMDCLEKLLLSLTAQSDYFLGTSSALVAQSRTAIKEERRVVLMHLDAVQKDIEDLNLNRAQLLAHIKNLQDDRRSMRLRMEQMVPRSEMSAAQQEAGARASDIRSLEKEGIRQREVIEGLNGRIGEMEREKSALLAKIQVCGPRSSSLAQPGWLMCDRRVCAGHGPALRARGRKVPGDPRVTRPPSAGA